MNMTLTTTKPEKPLIAKAMGVHTFREDRDDETEFVAISSSESVEAMSRFTGGDPTRIHHLERDPEFLIELPQRVQILKIRSRTAISAAAKHATLCDGSIILICEFRDWLK